MELSKISKKELLQLVTDLSDALYDVTINEVVVVEQIRNKLMKALTGLSSLLQTKDFEESTQASAMIDMISKVVELLKSSQSIDDLSESIKQLMEQAATFSPDEQISSSKMEDIQTIMRSIIHAADVISKHAPVVELEQTIKSASQAVSKLSSTTYYNPEKDLLSIVSRVTVDGPQPHIRCELRDISKKYGKLASITRHIDTKRKSVVINTGTHKYKSLRGNQFLLSLHFAECIFREILYTNKGVVDVDELDNSMDIFYESCYESLSEYLDT
tara:strand:+ start:1646 stop:2461 length:816 start_codon:yes stop_codon:yes gene_type:complete